ncbi:BspA family leucine-rich repeat surface protein [Cyclobacterium sp. 1_MG-2023]|uniref:BspA family leucine-rich repeat surface protein n=1 Tax=Cyclobacterium sp. 1_MG-2023 TaxID=3062681 RepID=UPI0026E2DFDD|nr:BspA family leucine-rich repeat surface protein [Cyclobacterium sp. 1_MG-2023]MDO6435938.1 BspA family leucine-rich repeat surface protein [Cyclobacterium sp. 1_MG-2023]
MKIFNLKYCLIAFTWLLVLQSCTDGEEMTPQNMAPSMTAQSFNVSEAAVSGNVLGTVSAIDPDGDALTFRISANDNNLFSISSSGALSLATGQSLDFETATSHTITVSVSDGELSTEADMSITVTDENENTAPEISGQPFTVAEDISVGDLIGTVVATDADGDALTFSISTNDSDLFEITSEGELSLATGKNLDFETATVHTITITVTDGKLATEAEMTINVTDVDETTVTGTGFITTWKTTRVNETIFINTNPDFTYNYSIDWGDGTIENGQTSDVRHSYALADTYTVEITGEFPAVFKSLSKIQTVEQWGHTQWKSMEYAFSDSPYLRFNASDLPDLSAVTNMNGMFSGATSFNSDISAWNVSSVTNMNGMFSGATSFNGDISAWDVSNVTEMYGMFFEATSFNGDLSSWDVSSVTDMNGMFNGAISFNSDLNDWDVSNVIYMDRMFQDAVSFNSDLNKWDVSSVEGMGRMFENATSFTSSLDEWDVTSVTTMQDMFFRAEAFNGDISTWNVSNVSRMQGMFRSAVNFNGDLSSWDVINVTDMYYMFNNAKAFSQDLSDWNTSSVTSCNGFSSDSGLTPDQLPTKGCFE